MAGSSHRSFLAALAVIVATHAATTIAQQVRIEQRLPGIMTRWTEQSDKKVRYAGYSLWVNAFDAAVRQANRAMCGADVIRSMQLSRVPGIMDLGEAGYVDFLDARDRVLHGGPDASKAKMRADLVHQWFTEQ